MKPIEGENKLNLELNHAQAKWRQLVFILLICDFAFTLTMDIIDLTFTSRIKQSKLILVIVKGALFFLFCCLVVYVLLTIKVELIVIISLSYLILGILLFAYLLFDEIKSIPSEDEMIPLTDSRPKSWRIYKIYLIMIVINCICGVSRFICSILMVMFQRVALSISLRLKNESLLNPETEISKKKDTMTLKTIEKRTTNDKSISIGSNSKITNDGMNNNIEESGLFVIKENANSMKKTYSSNNSYGETQLDKLETPRITNVLKK